MDNPDKCELTSPFELHGNWWRPDRDQNQRVAGCLTYTPDHGVQLQLYDDLPDEGWTWLKGEKLDRPIWGEVEGFAGKQVKVSLFGAIPTNRPNDPNAEDKPSAHTIYFINRAIVGAYALDPNSLLVTSIHFSVSDFESFVNTKPVAALYDGESVKVDYTAAKAVDITLQEPCFHIEINTHLGVDASLFDRNCTINYRDNMSLTPPKPIQFGDATDAVFSLQNFFLMCARESVELRYIQGVLESGEIISSFGSMRGRRKRRTTPRDWVLTLNEIGTSFQEVLNKWFVLVKKLRFVGPVFFSELTSPSPVQDARFFHFAGCLEAFHREVVQEDLGKFLPKKDYREITKSLLANLPPTVPEALKDAMRSALSHANDHSFAERIDALFNALEPETQKLLTDDPKRFVAAIKHSRNKLAHITDDPAGEVFEGKEFVHANLSLRAWLTILILKECGIAESVIRNRMNGISYFYWGPFKFNSPPKILAKN
jgi:hypothetical protein